MNHQLILVEGLPGSGKTTTAKLVQQILAKKGIEGKLFLEGDLDHPADFESVACLSEGEIHFQHISEFRKVGDDYLVPYRKLGLDLSDKDIYELPFEKNQELIAANWGRFAKEAEGVHIFECCFIQNPVTVGMIKYGTQDEQVIGYVKELEAQAAGLHPLLIYIDRDDVEEAFLKAVEERPKEWSQFFTGYYTQQGYGKRHGLTGIQGTIEVLKARKELERNIIDKLDMQKIIIHDLNNMSEVLKKYL
jgi:hypothetical protein